METKYLMMKPCMERKSLRMEFPMGSVEILMMRPSIREGTDVMLSNDSFGLLSETAFSKRPHRCLSSIG